MFARLAALIFALVITQSVSAHATNYYVSPRGNDLFFGTSPSLPWASIARVNRADLRSGDQVYFLRGGTWRDTLVPQASNLYYGAYGSGDVPVISGADLLGSGLLSPWLPVGGNVWFYPIGNPPAQLWFNGVLGTQVQSQSAVDAQLQWYYGRFFGLGGVFVSAGTSPAFKYTNPGIEAAQRSQALLVQNINGLKIEHVAFVNSEDVAACLCVGNNGQQVFNDVLFSGALNEGLRVVSGNPVLNASEVINNASGLNVTGGGGFTLNGSLISGNRNRAIFVNGTSATSSIYSSTVTGNSTANPISETITNFGSYALNASNSVLLPNPYQPKLYNYTGLTDAGNNVYQSPLLAKRATPLIVVPFIDDYNNLGVAQAVAKVASAYGCSLSYALNTKLVTQQAWSQIATLQNSGVEVVAHTRSHSDLANNNVFSIQYIGTAARATMTISQTTGFLQTFLNGSSTPDLNLSISDTYNGMIDVLSRIPAGAAYKVIIQPNQNYFTPINLANVSSVNIKTLPYVAQAGPGYLTWEIEGAQTDITANLPGYKLKAFATPFTSSNPDVEDHIRDAGFASNRNGLLNAASQPNGNWLMPTSLDVYNMGAEWLPFAYDAAKPASSAGALVEGLGASGGVMAVYSHGYDEFSLANWTDLFATLKQVGATCMTMSQANSYVESRGQLIPDGTSKNWIQFVPLTPDYSVTQASPTQGAQNLN